MSRYCCDAAAAACPGLSTRAAGRRPRALLLLPPHEAEGGLAVPSLARTGAR